MNPSVTKICTRCKKEKPATTENFHKRKLGKYGLRNMCSPCYSEYRKSIPSHQETKAKNRLTARAWNKANPERVKQGKRESYLRHRAEVISKAKQYRLDNPLYWKRTPEKEKSKSANRQARKRKVGGVFTKYDVILLKNKQHGLCHWCKEDYGDIYEIDHIIPMSKGGSNWPENICLSCKACNRQKGGRMPEEWLTDPLCRVK